MKAKAKLYGPMLLAALLCALVFATGAMKKPSEFELLNGQYMQLAGGKTRYAVADGARLRRASRRGGGAAPARRANTT